MSKAKNNFVLSGEQYMSDDVWLREDIFTGTHKECNDQLLIERGYGQFRDFMIHQYEDEE